MIIKILIVMILLELNALGFTFIHELFHALAFFMVATKNDDGVKQANLFMNTLKFDIIDNNNSLNVIWNYFHIPFILGTGNTQYIGKWKNKYNSLLSMSGGIGNHFVKLIVYPLIYLGLSKMMNYNFTYMDVIDLYLDPHNFLNKHKNIKDKIIIIIYFTILGVHTLTELFYSVTPFGIPPFNLICKIGGDGCGAWNNNKILNYLAIGGWFISLCILLFNTYLTIKNEKNKNKTKYIPIIKIIYILSFTIYIVKIAYDINKKDDPEILS